MLKPVILGVSELGERGITSTGNRIYRSGPPLLGGSCVKVDSMIEGALECELKNLNLNYDSAITTCVTLNE